VLLLRAHGVNSTQTDMITPRGFLGGEAIPIFQRMEAIL
jgi:hypothetical protein